MSLELWSSLASVGTFVVIAISAVLALVQLRHIRSGNQIAALSEMDTSYGSSHVSDARADIERLMPKLGDPAVRAELMRRLLPTAYRAFPTVGNLFESLGALVKHGVLDFDLVVDVWGNVVLAHWDQLQPFIALRRRVVGETFWENFEYLSVRMRDFAERHSWTLYPRGVRRLAIADPWLEEDIKAGIYQPKH